MKISNSPQLGLLFWTVANFGNPLAAAEGDSNDAPPAVYNNPIYVNGYADGVAAGIYLCRTNPAACGIGSATTLTPVVESVGGNYVITIRDGAKQCQEDPESCGIQVNQNTDGSTQAGREECQRDPSSCGIDVQGSKAEGIAQCRADPQSCGIIMDREALIQEGIDLCKAHPKVYGLETPAAQDGSLSVATFAIHDGALYLPLVEVTNPLDNSVLKYQARLQLVTGVEPLCFALVEAIPKASQ